MEEMLHPPPLEDCALSDAASLSDEVSSDYSQREMSKSCKSSSSRLWGVETTCMSFRRGSDDEDLRVNDMYWIHLGRQTDLQSSVAWLTETDRERGLRVMPYRLTYADFAKALGVGTTTLESERYCVKLPECSEAVSVAGLWEFSLFRRKLRNLMEREVSYRRSTPTVVLICTAEQAEFYQENGWVLAAQMEAAITGILSPPGGSDIGM